MYCQESKLFFFVLYLRAAVIWLKYCRNGVKSQTINIPERDVPEIVGGPTILPQRDVPTDPIREDIGGDATSLPQRDVPTDPIREDIGGGATSLPQRDVPTDPIREDIGGGATWAAAHDQHS